MIQSTHPNIPSAKIASVGRKSIKELFDFFAFCFGQDQPLEIHDLIWALDQLLEHGALPTKWTNVIWTDGALCAAAERCNGRFRASNREGDVSLDFDDGNLNIVAAGTWDPLGEAPFLGFRFILARDEGGIETETFRFEVSMDGSSRIMRVPTEGQTILVAIVPNPLFRPRATDAS